jgi:regulatory protein
VKEEGPDTPAALKARALRHLVRREHSRVELARKLAPHAASSEALQALLEELQAKKQLSDERYAEARAHWLSRKYGAARIRQDLKAHGVAATVAERVSSGGDLDKARAILGRKYRQPATTREEAAKRMRFLQSRGFSHDTIRRALRVDEEL